MSKEKKINQHILVLGSTGYVGGRLIPHLLEQGYTVRALGRSKEKLLNRDWAQHPNVELCVADVFNIDSLKEALKGCHAAFYLVHSMLPGQKDFQKADAKAAKNMVQAAEETSLKRIIYLSGLGEDQPDLSQHLKSRTEVAKILQQGKVPTTVLRAAMIIGSGSASFEILRYLVDRLPVMITPKWLKTPCQPIAIRNVIEYLVGCLDKEVTAGNCYDIGGSEIVTYRKLMETYAEVNNLPKRIIIPVPVLTPRLSSYWIHLVTPLPSSLARPLAEGLKNPVICKNNTITKIIPQKLLDCKTSIQLALDQLEQNNISTHWTDAGSLPKIESALEGDPFWAGGKIFQDKKELIVHSTLENGWKIISSLGGKTGWYHANFLWQLRGLIDKYLGGVGLRRGRRHPNKIAAGDALDFWRALDVEPNKHLLLLAEMKLPGKATLEFTLIPEKAGSFILKQTASFKPHGLLGLFYWYLVSPLHFYIFRGMAKKIKKKIEAKSN